MNESVEINHLANIPPDWLMKLTVLCAFVSGIVSIFGIVFLLVFFTVGGRFGSLNDIAVIIQYLLMIPIAITLWRLLRPYRPTLSLVAMVVGIAGMTAVILLQLLLVTGTLPFSKQIGMVIIAFLVVLAWFIINQNLGSGTNILPRSMLLTVLAGLYFGYPVWAFSLGRRLSGWTKTSSLGGRLSRLSLVG
jgi:hypothetical protein